MFTGIIESIGKIKEIVRFNSNYIFWIESPISPIFSIDQSVSHNGVCLTVEEISENSHRVTAVSETLQKTNMGSLKPGDLVNLEQCLLVNSRFDGHIVQGHVDSTGIVTDRKDKNGSTEFSFQFENQHAPLLIEKGSICINGVSLTVFDLAENRFSIAVIPYTINHTNLNKLASGDTVNLEFDVLGKYINRVFQLQKNDWTVKGLLSS